MTFDAFQCVAQLRAPRSRRSMRRRCRVPQSSLVRGSHSMPFDRDLHTGTANGSLRARDSPNVLDLPRPARLGVSDPAALSPPPVHAPNRYEFRCRARPRSKQLGPGSCNFRPPDKGKACHQQARPAPAVSRREYWDIPTKRHFPNRTRRQQIMVARNHIHRTLSCGKQLGDLSDIDLFDAIVLERCRRQLE